jgi:predicted aspartyl protease
VHHESPAALIRGEKGQVFFERLQIDPKAFFTTLPVETVLRIGASSIPLRVAIDLEDGRSVQSSVYSVGFSVRGQIGTSVAVAFDGARPVLGSKFLEDLGLRIDPKSGLLEPSRDSQFPRECEE